MQGDAPAVTLLMVDDEPSVLKIVSRILAKDGYEVLQAGSGEAAVEIMEQHGARVQLAVIDMSMPGMDGAQTTVKLQAIKPGLKVLVASGLCDEETMARFPANSVSGYLQKPYQREALCLMIAETLARGD
jgi:CheY-like chemotaxis protein